MNDRYNIKTSIIMGWRGRWRNIHSIRNFSVFFLTEKLFFFGWISEKLFSIEGLVKWTRDSHTSSYPQVDVHIWTKFRCEVTKIHWVKFIGELFDKKKCIGEFTSTFFNNTNKILNLIRKFINCNFNNYQ